MNERISDRISFMNARYWRYWRTDLKEVYVPVWIKRLCLYFSRKKKHIFESMSFQTLNHKAEVFSNEKK